MGRGGAEGARGSGALPPGEEQLGLEGGLNSGAALDQAQYGLGLPGRLRRRRRAFLGPRLLTVPWRSENAPATPLVRSLRNRAGERPAR